MRPRRQVNFENLLVLVMFIGRGGNQLGQDAARIVHQVAETLRDQDSVYITRRGLLEFLQVVIGQRLLQWNLDRHRGLVLVGNDAHGHGS